MIVSHDFINAKVRGMRSRLYESSRLLALCDARHLPDLVRRIYPQRPVGSCPEFERELTRDCLAELDLIRRYVNGPVLEALSWLMRRHQLANVKVALRHFLAGGSADSLAPLLVPAPRWLDLPLQEMLGAADLRGFVAAIPVEELRTQAELAMSEGDPADRPFRVEMGLDLGYCERLGALATALPAKARSLVRLDIDGSALLSVLRAGRAYDMEFADIRPFLPVGSGTLDERAFAAVHEAEDLAAALSAIPRSVLPAAAREGVAELADLEFALLLRMYRLANRYYYGDMLDVGVIVAYAYIKRVELANLTRLTESVRYGFPREEIVRRLLFAGRMS